MENRKPVVGKSKFKIEKCSSRIFLNQNEGLTWKIESLSKFFKRKEHLKKEFKILWYL